MDGGEICTDNHLEKQKTKIIIIPKKTTSERILSTHLVYSFHHFILLKINSR